MAVPWLRSMTTTDWTEVVAARVAVAAPQRFSSSSRSQSSDESWWSRSHDGLARLSCALPPRRRRR